MLLMLSRKEQLKFLLSLPLTVSGFVCIWVCFSSLVLCSELKKRSLSPILFSCHFSVIGVCLYYSGEYLSGTGGLSWDFLNPWVKNSGVALPADLCLILCFSEHWWLLILCRSLLFLTHCCSNLCSEKLVLLCLGCLLPHTSHWQAQQRHCPDLHCALLTCERSHSSFGDLCHGLQWMTQISFTPSLWEWDFPCGASALWLTASRWRWTDGYGSN